MTPLTPEAIQRLDRVSVALSRIGFTVFCGLSLYLVFTMVRGEPETAPGGHLGLLGLCVGMALMSVDGVIKAKAGTQLALKGIGLLIGCLSLWSLAF